MLGSEKNPGITGLLNVTGSLGSVTAEKAFVPIPAKDGGLFWFPDGVVWAYRLSPILKKIKANKECFFITGLV